MNRVVLIGNLVRDCELTTTSNNISLCKFSIAVNRAYANANGEREADFINIVAWRTIADNCGKYLSKGKKVAVCGSLQTRSYDDKDGNKRYVTEIVADDVEFLSPSGGQATADETKPSAPRQQKMSELEPINADDLPF